jgi:hypothetical protein
MKRWLDHPVTLMVFSPETASSNVGMKGVEGELGHSNTLTLQSWCVHRETTRVCRLLEAVADRNEPGLAERRAKE